MDPKTAEQKTTQGTEAAAALVAKAVADALAPIRAELTEALAQVKAARTTSNTAGMVDGSTKPESESAVTSDQREVKAPDGFRAIRVMKAQMLAKMRGGDATAEKILKGWGYDFEARVLANDVKKALSVNVFADGGALVPPEFSMELIALLRNKTAVRQLGARVLPMGASLTLPAQTAASTSYYVGEAQAVTPSQQALGDVRFNEKKLMALVAVSNDLIRNAAIDAEAFIRDDVVQVLRLREDYQSIFGVGGEHSPRGIVSLAHTDGVYNSTAVSQAAPTLAEVKKELAKAKRKLKTGNIPMERLGWIMSPRTEEWLYSITDGNGNSVFQAALDAGTLHGAPVIVTNQIPENLTWSVDGSTDVSRLIFGDFSQFIIGESMGLEVEMFPNATYDSTGSGTIVSGISNDQSVIRAIQKHDFQLRHQKAMVVVSLRWGA